MGAQPMTDELLGLALTRYAYFNEGTNLVRGDPIPDGDSLPEITGMDLDISHSQEVAEMLSQDLAALQKVQEETIAVRTVRKDTFASKCMDIVKSTLKLTEDSPSLRKEYLEYLEEAHNNYLVRYEMREDISKQRDGCTNQQKFGGRHGGSWAWVVDSECAFAIGIANGIAAEIAMGSQMGSRLRLQVRLQVSLPFRFASIDFMRHSARFRNRVHI
jgi:hypothetical protein